MVQKVCSCCLKVKKKKSYDEVNWAAGSLRRCQNCAAVNRLIPANPGGPMSSMFPGLANLGSNGDEDIDGIDREHIDQLFNQQSISVEDAEGLLGFRIPPQLLQIAIPDSNGNLRCPMPAPFDTMHQDVLDFKRSGSLYRDECVKCGKRGTEESPLKSCTKCNRYCYCSKECQIEDWKRHRHEECLGSRKGERFCGKCGVEGTLMCSLKKCTRCNNFFYCSRSCQVDDWKRHKVEDCQKKDKKKKLQQRMKVNILDKMFNKDVLDEFEENYERGGGRQIISTDWYKKIKTESTDVSPLDRLAHDSLINFLRRFHTQMSIYALYHVEKYQQLKGALFIFSKVSLFDLCDVPPVPTVPTGSDRGRMFAMIWGYDDKDTSTEGTPSFTYRELAKKFTGIISDLPSAVDSCSRWRLPVVFCCDPSGRRFPQGLSDALKLPKKVDPVHYVDESPPMVSACIMPNTFECGLTGECDLLDNVGIFNVDIEMQSSTERKEKKKTNIGVTEYSKA